MAHRRAFTLIEVLIAGVILGIGLIGLAAVFPVVISQQRDAVDRSQAIAAGASGEAILSTRLSSFASTMARIPEKFEGQWIRISAADPDGDDPAYLRMPRGLRIRIDETLDNLRGQQAGTLIVYDEVVNNPISEADGDLVVTIVLDGNVPVRLVPDETNRTVFKIANRKLQGVSINAGHNQIDYENGVLKFNLNLQNGQTATSAKVDYTWLNDRLLSHHDRMYPSENARYAWEVTLRKSFSGQAQYCLFIYRFDGPTDAEFKPDVPESENSRTSGMLRYGSFTVRSNRQLKRYYIEDVVNRNKQIGLFAGAYLLPVNGSAPVRVKRQVRLPGEDDFVWELESPPLVFDGEGSEPKREGTFDFWFMPKSFFHEEDQVTWKVTPLLAYTKQVDLN